MIDINLRDQATYYVADELVQQRIPFCFATGYSAGVIPDRFRDVTRWQKPYDVRKLVDDVARLCNLTVPG